MSKQENPRFYITTPIYYANGHPHLGNTYSTTIADALTRFYRYRGYDAFFLTGTDEHGDKVAQAATDAGKTPQEFTDQVSVMFQTAWKEMGLEYSRFIRTTEPKHKKVVTDLLQKIYDQGDIYFGEYGGNYCFGCERFLTDKELVDGKCPDHQTVPKYVQEKNYFFKMAKYQDRLIEHMTKTNPDFVRPERYKNEALAMLREPLEDLCISRPKSRLTWGIELPFDPEYVTYVWFDALINYLSGIDYPDGPNFNKFWPSAEHLIAKDILKPHAIFWPTMLFAAGLEPYKHLNVHGYWVTPTGKMSKSLGNVVNPLEIKAEFGADVFRYFVMREMTFGLDGTFARESFETRYNADLANNLGNLVSRTIAMVEKYRAGLIPAAGPLDSVDEELKSNVEGTIGDVIELVSRMELHRALERIWSAIDAANLYIDRTKPWTLAKEEAGGAGPERLNTVLHLQVEAIRVVASILTGFMPETSIKILSAIGFKDENLKAQQKIEAAKWGGLPAGNRVSKGESLFPRYEKKDGPAEDNAAPLAPTKNEKTRQKMDTAKPMEQTTDDGKINYDDFSKVSLRVGQILQAERVEKSEKLLKLSVDLGETEPRQIIAGIGKRYAPEEIVGRKVAVVANLKPAKLMGQVSNGMLLAGSDDSGNLELLEINPILAPGSVIK
jgi:methionyl-tRNA synthetase